MKCATAHVPALTMALVSSMRTPRLGARVRVALVCMFRPGRQRGPRKRRAWRQLAVSLRSPLCGSLAAWQPGSLAAWQPGSLAARFCAMALGVACPGVPSPARAWGLGSPAQKPPCPNAAPPPPETWERACQAASRPTLPGPTPSSLSSASPRR